MKGWRYESARHAMSARGIKSYNALQKALLYHGTPMRNIESIREKGLLRGGPNASVDNAAYREVWGATDPLTAKEYAEGARRFSHEDARQLRELARAPGFMEDFMHARFPNNRMWNVDEDPELKDTTYMNTWRSRIIRADPMYIDDDATRAIKSLEEKYPQIKDIKGFGPDSVKGTLVVFPAEINIPTFRDEEDAVKKKRLAEEYMRTMRAFAVDKDVPKEHVKILSRGEAERKYEVAARKKADRAAALEGTHVTKEDVPLPEGWFAQKVDLKRYAGTWKQESVKNEPWFQKGLQDVTATYKPRKDGKITVINKGVDAKGRVKVAKGVARSVSEDNRRLKVSFAPFGLFEGEYNIKKISPDYKRAVVQGGKTTWVLKKTKSYMAQKYSPEEFNRWRQNVNMSPRELERFMKQYGKTAGLSRKEASAEGIKSGRDSARAIISMKQKPVAKWNENDVKWMRRQNSFVARMRGARGSLYDDKGRPTRKLLALKVWGHDPEKVSR